MSWITDEFLELWFSRYGTQDQSGSFGRQCRQCRPSIYYANSVSTFQPLLVGDLVFKINPGPMYNAGLRIQSRSLTTGNRNIKKSSRNTGNLMKINSSMDVAALNRNRAQSLLLFSLNPRSVRNKTADMFDYVCDCKADLFAFTETWLRDDDDAVRAEICPNGYTFISYNRIGRRRGGTGLMFRDSLGVKKVDGREFESFEFSEWLITGNSSNVRLVIIYRPPYSDDHPVTVTTFCAEFARYMESTLLKKERLVIVGDLNIYFDDKVNSDALNFLDVLESLGLQQHVNDSTHIHGHTLDLIITRTAEKPHVDRYFSDHASVLCKLVSYKPRLSHKKVNYRKIKSVDVSALVNELAESSLCKNISRNSNVDILSASDLDNLAETYNNTLSHLQDSHAPLKTKTVVSRPKVAWYNDEIHHVKLLRRKAERKWRKTKQVADFLAFKEKRNNVTYLLNKAKHQYYTEFVDENSSDQGRIFRASKKLLGYNDSPLFTHYEDKSLLVNEIGKFFAHKIVKIRDQIDAKAISTTESIPDDPSVDEAHLFSKFQPLCQSDVLKRIRKSSKKSCSLDPKLVLASLEQLLTVITQMINSSLLAGHFPKLRKEALVDPRQKKEGINDFSNLRPVSKLTERAVFDQVHVHDLYPKLQSAYRRGHSTETALLKIHNDILIAMDRQHVILLVLLDLSAAFDTVEHSVLLSRLSNSFGIRDTALCWFRSYLSDRSQRVSLDGKVSDKFQLTHGFPQGSCLGPLLFTLYVSKLFDIIKGHLPHVHTYADDTQLYLAFKPDSAVNALGAVNAMELCIRDLRTWMLHEKLKLNDNKTEFILIGTRQQLAKVDGISLCVGDSKVSQSNQQRTLAHG